MLMAACVSPALFKTRILVLSIDVERLSKFEMILKGSPPCHQLGLSLAAMNANPC
jgi:hypothetical protein